MCKEKERDELRVWLPNRGERWPHARLRETSFCVIFRRYTNRSQFPKTLTEGGQQHNWTHRTTHRVQLVRVRCEEADNHWLVPAISERWRLHDQRGDSREEQTVDCAIRRFNDLFERHLGIQRSHVHQFHSQQQELLLRELRGNPHDESAPQRSSTAADETRISLLHLLWHRDRV